MTPTPCGAAARPRSLAGVRASRAMARAIRLAEEPPPVRLPRKLPQPIACASHSTTVRSIVTAAGAERHAHILVEYAGEQVGDRAHRFTGTQHVAEKTPVLHARVFDHLVQSRHGLR